MISVVSSVHEKLASPSSEHVAVEYDNSASNRKRDSKIVIEEEVKQDQRLVKMMEELQLSKFLPVLSKEEVDFDVLKQLEVFNCCTWVHSLSYFGHRKVIWKRLVFHLDLERRF